MVTLYVEGQKVGTLADAERLFPGLVAQNKRVEFRDEAGNSVGTFHPTRSVPGAGPDPDWVAAITPEETARRMAEPGFTFEELKKRLGWE